MANVVAQTGYDLACYGCGAAVRPVDRFCSQCGRRDPARQEAALSDDPVLTSSTVVGHDTEVPEATSPTLIKSDTGGPARKNTLAVQTMLAPGSVFARRYRIQRFLGSGAMGYVCSAVDESIDEVVALKVLSLPIHEDPDAFERFKNELKLARRIRHRNVVQSFDLGSPRATPSSRWSTSTPTIC